ncbi:MAG: response regulator [Rhizomicrobium sp.]
MLNQLRNEFNYHASAQGLVLHVVTSTVAVYSDPRLLGQMLRSILSNSMKWAKRGKILLGCRRRRGFLSIEVWDTGTGFAEQDLERLFDEYHQVTYAVGERTFGGGFGLSILQQLATLLGHPVRIRTEPDKACAFTIDVTLSAGASPVEETVPRIVKNAKAANTHLTTTILVVENDSDVRNLLNEALTAEGHNTATVEDGPSALALIADGSWSPNLILTDYNLPNGMDGLSIVAEVSRRLHRPIPAIILTGDIAKDALQRLTSQGYLQLNKPIKTSELTESIQHVLLHEQQLTPQPALHAARPVPSRNNLTIFVIDDDKYFRESIRCLLESYGCTVEDFASGEAFREAYPSPPQMT